MNLSLPFLSLKKNVSDLINVNTSSRKPELIFSTKEIVNRITDEFKERTKLTAGDGYFFRFPMMSAR